MRFLVLGGDARQKILAELLSAEGNEVFTELPRGRKNADCIILPVPVEDGTSGMLYAPFCENKLRICDILEYIPDGSLAIGGKLPTELKQYADMKNICAVDLMTRPEFTVGNAAITAEGAVFVLMQKLKKTLSDSKVSVIGYGRIGRLLSDKLTKLGASVTVVSRSSQSRAMAKSLGMDAVSANAVHDLGGFDAIVNTAPSPLVLSYDGIKNDCVLLELASPPYGFDAALAREKGLDYVLASGLPGKYAPYSAAYIICECVKNIIKERENDKA